MLTEFIAVARLNSSKTCFVDFSKELCKFQEELCGGKSLLESRNVPLLIKKSDAYFVTSWSGKCVGNDGDHELHIDREFASHYGIEDNSNVHIKFISEHIPAAHQVTVSPCRRSDWEILQLNSCHIENILLDQISFIDKGLVFPLYLSPSTVISLKVVSTNPHRIVFLQEYAEVIVTPFNDTCEEIVPLSPQIFVDERKYLDCEYTYINNKRESPNANADNFIISKLIKCMNAFVNPENSSQILESERHAEKNGGKNSEKLSGSFVRSSKERKLELQIQPIPTLCNGIEEPSSDVDKQSMPSLVHGRLPPYQGFMCKDVFQMENDIDMVSSCFEMAVKLDSDKLDEDEYISSDSNEIKLVLQIKILPLSVWNDLFQFADNRILYVNPLVIEQLQSEVGTKVFISCFEGTVDTIQGIVLHCVSSDQALHQKIKDTFSSSLELWSNLSEVLIINQGTLFKFSSDNDYIFAVGELIGVTRNVCGKVDKSSIKDFFVHVEEDESREIIPSKYTKHMAYDFCRFTSDIIEHFKLSFRLMMESQAVTPLVNYQPFVLLHGKSLATSNGCGKTLISQSVANYFSLHPYFCHVEYIDCILMKGKKVNSICKHWVNSFESAFVNEPSIIIFDDLDELISDVDLIQDGYMKNEYCERLGDLFCSFVKSIFNGNKKICIIVTATFLEGLHSCVLPQLNSHLFTKFVCVSDISLDNADMLDWFIQDSAEKQIRFDVKLKSNLTSSKDLKKKLETFNVKSCNSITQRTLQSKFNDSINFIPSSVSNELTVNLDVTASDIENNLATFDSILMNNLKVNKPKTVSWKNIGGLKSVKETLKETLLWPVLYPDLLANCPLRLCSGVLLYGAPGTAKTMLASAVAYESNLNFISVKGPELLSKYIGSSESNVRDLFARAESAKPCIVFFDELESIAPRRGHDNTGVTDRVVNQLLTQLDGVESLSGVFVLAATSRPDLVDPALLRPGRLDKSIHCPMPSEEERTEILGILMKEIKTDCNIDNKLLSSRTAGFSGADLKALVFNAQVESAHEYLKDFKESTNGGSQFQKSGLVTMDHFISALETTRPSVSTEEKKKYFEIFANFSCQHKTDNVSDRMQKVTLA